MTRSSLSLRHRLSLLPLAAASLLGAAGCTEDVDSTDIRTQGMHPIYEAVSYGEGGIDVTGELRVGGSNGTYVVLVGGDRLVAFVTPPDSDEETSEVLDPIDNGLRYLTGFEGDEGGTKIRVAFERPNGNSSDGDSNAPNSTVVLPEPFALGLTNLEEGVEIPRGYNIDLEWDPTTSGVVEWRAEGDCIWSSSGTTNDDGEFSIPAEDIEVTNLNRGKSCEVTVTVDRINEGKIDSAFEKEGGSIRAAQRRTVVFRSTPAPGEEKAD